MDQVKEQLYTLTGSEGEINIQGRTLHYKVRGGTHEGEFHYKGEAWDKEAEISVKTGKYEGENGARVHAMEDLVAELKKLGLLKD